VVGNVPSSGKRSVLFLCTHNSCRSQMAEALMKHTLSDRFEAHSAGIEPSGVDPRARRVLEELGIETSSLRSKSAEEFLDDYIDMVVTVCDRAKEACPFFPGAGGYMHRSFVDPPDLIGEGIEPLEAFRRIRDEIEEWLLETFSHLS